MEALDIPSFTMAFSLHSGYLYSIESKLSKVIFFTSFRDLPLQVVICCIANGGGDCCLTRWYVTVAYPKTNDLTNFIALGPS